MTETETIIDWFTQLWIDSFDGSIRSPAYSVYMLIVSNHHQMGKTSFGLRVAEQITERLTGKTFDPNNIAFTIPSLMQRRKQIPSRTFQVLDEPQQAISSRQWHAEEHEILAEDLMMSSRHLKPVLYPFPLTSMLDNKVYDISTSQAVIPRLGFADIYYLERSLLDRRNRKVRTYKLGYLSFEKPGAVLWHEYMRRFNEYYEKKRERDIAKIESLQSEADKTRSSLQPEQLVALIMEKPQDYIGKNGLISVTKIQVKHGVPYNRAQQSAALANEQLKAKEELERSENE